MRYLIYIIFSIVILSCNNRLDPLKKANLTPLFTVNGSDNIWASEESKSYSSILNDSVKIFRKYKINYKIEEEEQASVYLKSDGYKGLTEYNGVSIQDSTLILIGDGQLLYTPYVEGLNSFNYTITDPYQNTSTVTVNLECFKNKSPTANFNIEYEGINSQYEYEIDARSSYDGDAKFGGGILRYRMMIDLDTNYNSSGLFHYIFNAPGTYTVAVQAMDNDSVWGLKKEESFIVN